MSEPNANSTATSDDAILLPNANDTATTLRALSLLIASFFLCRLVFQQFVALKAAFIYPTGLLVEQFYGFGDYIEGQWLFPFGATQFVLAESCSGSTFFGMLVAYIGYRMVTSGVSVSWLVVAYGITIVANAMRVVSAMYGHSLLSSIGGRNLQDELHVLTGTVVYVSCFLLFTRCIEHRSTRNFRGAPA